jgi:hypothetical protein
MELNWPHAVDLDYASDEVSAGMLGALGLDIPARTGVAQY